MLKTFPNFHHITISCSFQMLNISEHFDVGRYTKNLFELWRKKKKKTMEKKKKKERIIYYACKKRSTW